MKRESAAGIAPPPAPESRRQLHKAAESLVPERTRLAANIATLQTQGAARGRIRHRYRGDRSWKSLPVPDLRARRLLSLRGLTGACSKCARRIICRGHAGI